MVKTFVRLMLVLGLLMSLTGCWDKDELDELGIALALGIDIQGDLYKVSAQVVLPTEVASKSGKGGNTVTLYEATAPTLIEVVRELVETSPRVLYIPQLRVVVLGEAYARRGISNMVETLMRDVFARTDYFVIVAKGHQAREILEVATPLDRIPASQLFSSLLASSKTWAPATTVTIDQLMTELVSDGIHPVLTGIQIVHNEPSGQDNGEENLIGIKPKNELRVSSLAVFKKDRLIGWLNERESKGYNYIRDKVDQTFGHIALENGLVGLRVLRSSTEKKVKIVDGEPQIQVKVSNIATLVEIGETDLSLHKQEDIQLIQDKSAEFLVQILQEVCDTVRHKFKVDIFGFGELVHQSDPKAWKKLKHNWDQTFSELQIDFSGEVQVKRVGQLGDTYQKKMREKES